MLVLFLGASAAASPEEPEIHRCTQGDGTVSFQQTPCAPKGAEEPAVVEPAETTSSSDDFFDFENPYDAPPEPSPGPPPEQETTTSASLSGDRQQCEKETREAIDAIDLKLQRSDNKEDDRAHLDELLKLTRRLRQCKEL